jgi:putative transposase
MRFLGKGYPMALVLRLLGLSKSTFYYTGSSKPGGRPPSTHTLRMDGTMDPNEVVLGHILALLGQDFVDYGYRKVTEWLKWIQRYLINGKKVARLMRENKLMLPRPGSSTQGMRRRIAEKVPQPALPGTYFELDIKMIRIRGSSRKALVLSIIDLFHREWLGYCLGWRMRKEDVIKLMEDLFGGRKADPHRQNITLRADNGSQFIAQELAAALPDYGIGIEFIHPATPEENGHIESFHSVMQRALVKTHEFESMQQLAETIKRFHHFYNHQRLHSATCYRPPMVFLELWKMGFVGEHFDKRNKRKFILRKEEPVSPPFSEQISSSLKQC